MTVTTDGRQDASSAPIGATGQIAQVIGPVRTPRVRRWLYLAVLRLIRREGVRDWYRAKKQQGPKATKKALVGVMRKLAVALQRITVSGIAFEPRRLFPGASPKDRNASGSNR